MPAFDEHFKQEVRLRNDLVAVANDYGLQLKQAGGRYKGLCPFHRDSDPSFYINPQLQVYKCFGCNAGGDVISFVMQMEKLDFPAAVERLAERAGLPLPQYDDAAWAARKKARETTLALNKLAGRFYYSQLVTQAGAQGLAYLKRRGLTDQTIRRFGLGFAPDRFDSLLQHAAGQNYSAEALIAAGLAQRSARGNTIDLFRGRVMFPILDDRGNLVGFGGRVMGDGQPKYLNSPQTPVFDKHRCLYGLHRAIQTGPHQQLILVEGYMDVLALHQNGFENAVAALGTAFGADHAKLIKRFVSQVVVCFDGDAAGVKAAQRSFDILQAEGLSVRVLRIENGQDPDELIAAQGPQAFADAVAHALTVPDFLLLLARESHPMQDTRGRAAFAARAAEILAGIPSPVAREEHLARWLPKLAADTGISEQSLYDEVAENLRRLQIRPPQRRQQPAAEQPQPAQAAQPVPPVEQQAITLLYENPGLAAQWIDRLQPEDFTHPLCRQLYAALQQAGGQPSAVPLDTWPQDQQQLALQLLVCEVPGDRAVLMPQLANRLRRNRLQQQADALTAQLATTPPDRLPAVLEQIERINQVLAGRPPG